MSLTAPPQMAAAGAVDAMKIYGSGDSEVRALDGVTVTFEPSRFSAIMGPSGSGKSTLLHCLAGLDTLTSGAVFIGETYLATLNDKQLTELRREQVGFVFQAYNLVPTLTAYENITLPLALGGIDGDRAWIDQVIDTVGLRNRLKHRPSELSGGQQQRVAVARALASRPKIIFADEPTGNLDSRAGAEILDFMRRAVKELGQTIVMVTHDPGAAGYSDRVIFLGDGKVVDEMADPTAEHVLDRLKRIGDELMIGTITRRSVLARKARFIIIGLAILLGVAFVSGSFILADSLRSTFDSLFSDITKDVDLEVRSSQAFDGGVQATRDPVPTSLVDTVAAIDGVQTVEPSLSRYAQLIDSDGKVVATQGAPTLGVSWSGPGGLSGVTLREGEVPNGPDQVAVDQATADRAGFEIGDTVSVITDTGTHQFELVGLIGLGDSKGFAGATVAAFDNATAQDVLDSQGFVDTIDIGVADGSDPAQVQAAIAAALPERTEVITGEQVAEEASEGVNQFIGIFGNGLLGFAFVTAFVSAFIINNVFAITIGQRLQELALLRAIGASARQVRRMVLAEALLVSVIATIIGIASGVLVAKGIIALFNAAGAGFPSTGIVLAPRTVIAAFIVGVGITLVSVLVPARRAARVPPVAAMRPEIGFVALTSSRRKVLGTVVTVLGAVLFLVGLFARPGGTLGTIALMAAGVLLLFLGVASLSAAFAGPAARLLGWPIDRLLKTPGHLARENAARNPRRTASTASALMIGVALVCVAAVFATSLKTTFSGILEQAVKADYILTDESFQGLPPAMATELSALPELSAVSPIRGIQAEIEGGKKDLGAVDGSSFGQLVDLDVTAGRVEDLTLDTVMLHTDPAKDLDVGIGDNLDVTYLNGVTGSLRVVGIYNDASLAGNWLISLDTLEQVSTEPPRDFFVLAKLADGVDPVVGRAAIESVLTEFPQTKLQDQAEFRRDQEGQIDQLLTIISFLLVFAIVIAVLGIAITLALSVYERTRELGLMRAVGMTRRQTRRMVRWEAVIVSVFGAVLGVVLGTVLGALLATAVPDTVINVVKIPVGLIIAIVLGAIVAGIVAAWWPARKASKMDVLEAIATT